MTPMHPVVAQRRLHRAIRAALMSLAVLGSGLAVAAISEKPPLTAAPIDPNLFYTLDDSGSMQYEYMPQSIDIGASYVFPRVDGTYGGEMYADNTVSFKHTLAVARLRSSTVNRIYYNPAIRYLPFQLADGTFMANANPKAAYHNPRIPTAGTRDLTVDNTATTDWTDSFSETRTFWPAIYYRHNGGDINTLANYTRVEIRSGATYPKAVDRTDCLPSTATTCTYDQEIQNFANWYSYARSRILLARAGSGRAFSSIGANVRVGFGAINKGSTTVDGASHGTVIKGVRSFTGTDRTAWYNALYDSIIPKAGTPLRRATDDVGRYFLRTDNNGPWSAAPGTGNTTPQLSCRQNFHILMTDGYWNDITGATLAAGNQDGTAGAEHTRPDGTTYQYQPVSPFTDDYADTLADAGMYYWKTDLRPDMAVNNVPTKPSNPAFWQHLAMHTIGLGVAANTITQPMVDAALADGTTLTWPQASTNQIDDLFHAAVNGRGSYSSAMAPDDFTKALDAALKSIQAQFGAVSAVAASGSQLVEGQSLFAASYRSDNWSGNLTKYKLRADGSVDPLPVWHADALIADEAVSPNARTIFTYDPAIPAAKPFQYTSLSSAQQTLLNNDPNLVKYLRGDMTVKDKNGAPFRKRTSRLGDIINSGAVYLKEGINHGYQFMPSGYAGRDSYAAFLEAKKNRAARVFVGANDGMLHAFDAETGKETFAYVPNSIIGKLPRLADPNYNHAYYVDGTATVGDAYINGSWRTILLGTTGAGGKSVFALDVTDPSTGFDASKILWEKTDAELGFTFSKAQIARMPGTNGEWIAILGNGPEQTNHTARLITFRLRDGAVLRVNTGQGDATTPNGLGTPRLVLAQDATLQTIYAGDLHGNIWKFPVTAAGGIALSFPSMYKHWYRPITAEPAVIEHPLGGHLVTYGSGKLYETGDELNTNLQSIFGIWDKPGAGSVTSSTELQEQVMTLQNINGRDYVSLTSNPVDWSVKRGWFIHLKLPYGDRVVTGPSIRLEQAFYTTITPGGKANSCDGGGTSKNLRIDPLTGGSLDFATIDTNGDDVINEFDAPVSGYLTAPTFGTTILIGRGTARSFMPGGIDSQSVPRAKIEASPALRTLRSWRQLFQP